VIAPAENLAKRLRAVDEEFAVPGCGKKIPWNSVRHEPVATQTAERGSFDGLSPLSSLLFPQLLVLLVLRVA
jgi:hypothetical protein